MTEDEKAIHIPSYPNQGAFDSFAESSDRNKFDLDVFQITVAKEHPVKTSYIKDLCEAVKTCFGRTSWKKVKVRFIFIVPGRNYNSFSMQPFIKPDNSGAYTKAPYTVCLLEMDDLRVEDRMADKKFKEHELQDGILRSHP